MLSPLSHPGPDSLNRFAPRIGNRLRTRNYLLIACAGAALLSLLGCQRDAIETHRVEIPEPPEPKVRLLGAMIPHDKDIWFFKLVGKLDAVEPLNTPFEDFVRSVRFDKPGEPITWELPKGWEQGAKKPDRYATFEVGPETDRLDLTVHRYDNVGEMSSIPRNVSRWGRMYAGVKVAADEWKEFVHEDKTAVGEVPITFVDIKGPGSKGGGMMPPFAGDANPHAPPENPHARPEKIGYTAPEGWQEAERVVQRGGIEVRYDVALKIEKGGSSAQLTVSKFPSSGNGVLLRNVNRWRRDQLGLPELDEGQLQDALKKVKLGNADGQAVDFIGPGKPPEKGGRRILGVVVQREGLTWFIKMDGPPDLVGEQKAAFDKFLGSVKFDGGNGG